MSLRTNFRKARYVYREIMGAQNSRDADSCQQMPDPFYTRGTRKDKSMDSEHVDVLIVGAGTTGLMNALMLARCGICNIRIISKSPSPNFSGGANGVQPRTQELFRSLGLFHATQKDAGAIVDTAFWEHGQKGKGIQRQHSFAEVANESPYRTVVTQNQGRIKKVLERELRRMGILVDRSHEFLDFGYAHDKEYQVCAYVKNLERGRVEQQHCKYLIAADGINSKVRQCTDITTSDEGPGGEEWIIADCIAHTDFPDFRKRCITRTIQGNAMLVPIHHDMIRVYLLLSNKEDLKDINHSKLDSEFDVNTNKNNRITLKDILERRLPQIMKPYTLEIEEIEWITKHTVNQRISTSFLDSKRRIILTGDSGHTPSLKANQGMDSGLQDAANLAWKLSLVLRERASPGLLETYNTERQHIAHEFQDFDTRFASMFGMESEQQTEAQGNASTANANASNATNDKKKSTTNSGSSSKKGSDDPSSSFAQTWRLKCQPLTTGLGHRYPPKWPLIQNPSSSSSSFPSNLVLCETDSSHSSSSSSSKNKDQQQPEPLLMPGKRLLPMRLTRHLDGRDASSLDTMPARGEFWVVCFVGNIALETKGEKFGRLYSKLTGSPAGEEGKGGSCIFDVLNGGRPSDGLGWGCEDLLGGMSMRDNPAGKKAGGGKGQSQAEESKSHHEFRKLVNLYVVHTSRRKDLELRPRFELWKWMFFEDADGWEHRRHGVHPGGEGVAVVVRPDHVVGAVYPADESLPKRLGEYFDGVMAPALANPEETGTAAAGAGKGD